MSERTANAVDTARAPEVRNAVIRYVLDNLLRGEWEAGHRLPTEAELAARFSTSQSNVNQAMKLLEQEGFVRRYRRRGTFAARAHPAAIGRAMNRVKPRATRLHVIAPLIGESAEVHWNSAALGQLEVMANHAGLQVEHQCLPNNPTPAQFESMIGKLNQEESWGIVILVALSDGIADENDEQTLLPYVRALLNYPGRVCLFNRSGAALGSWPYDAVSLAPLDEGIAVGRYLVQHGVRRVICAGAPRHAWGRLRVAGVEMAMRDPHAAGAKLQTHWIDVEDDDRGKKFFARMLDGIRSCKDRPTIVVPNDHYAAALLDIARERGLSCPESFCVISFDNNDRYRSYNITSVAPPASHIGKVIGQVICDQVTRPVSSTINLSLKSVIVERTTFALPQQDRHSIHGQ